MTHLASIAYADNAGQRPGGVNGEVVYAQQTLQPQLVVGADLPEAPTAVLIPVAAMLVLGAGAYGLNRLPRVNRGT